MSEQVEREEIRMRYLLRELSEEEKESLEERFFSDDQEFEELEIAETELIDRYLDDTLSLSERTLFEKTLVTSPRLAERVQFGKLIASRLPKFESADAIIDPASRPGALEPKSPANRWWRKLFGFHSTLSPAFAAAAVFVLVAGVLLAFVWTRYQNESQRLAAETQHRIELEKQIADLKSRSDNLDQHLQQSIREKEELLAKLESLSKQTELPASRLAVFLLVPGGTRSVGAQGSDHRIPPGTSTVELQMDVSGGDYQRYNASVQTVEGKVLFQARGLRPTQSHGKKLIRLQVAAKRLPPDDYITKVDGVTATGATGFGYYSFRITSR